MVYVAEDTPDEHNGLYDNAFKETIVALKKTMVANNDDGIIFLAGDTGTGKSTLSQHIINIYSNHAEYDKDCTTFSLEQYGRRLEQLSLKAHQKIVNKESPIGGYVAGDEFDYQAIENQSKKNRGVDKIFNVIRLYQILQVLCWPQLEKIPKAFLKDRVKFIYVLNSKEEKARTYILYVKDNIRRMVSDGIESFDMTTLTNDKIVQKYASVIGWFRSNPNIENHDYVVAKSEAILNRVVSWNKELQEGEPIEVTDEEGNKHAQKIETRLNLKQVASYAGLDSWRHAEEALLSLVKRGLIDYEDVYHNKRYVVNKKAIEILLKDIAPK